jgi:hypothetical protein
MAPALVGSNGLALWYGTINGTEDEDQAIRQGYQNTDKKTAKDQGRKEHILYYNGFSELLRLRYASGWPG